SPLPYPTLFRSRFLSVRATFGRIIVSALEGCRLRRARRDPAADQVELRGRERPADERHLYSFGGLDVAQELLEEEARVGVAGDDAQRAGGLRRGVLGGHADQIAVG